MEKTCNTCSELKSVDEFYKSRNTYDGECKLCRKTKKASKPLYNIWTGLRHRCNGTNGAEFADYGGRGITVCNEWSDFKVFEAWALLNGYTKGLSLDRKDNDGNYSPDNCRWATSIVQNNNRRSSRLYELNGISKTLRDWCTEYNANYNATWYRINTRGLPIEVALNK